MLTFNQNEVQVLSVRTTRCA